LHLPAQALGLRRIWLKLEDLMEEESISEPIVPATHGSRTSPCGSGPSRFPVRPYRRGANGMDPSPTIHHGPVQVTIGAMAMSQTQGRVQHASDNGGYGSGKERGAHPWGGCPWRRGAPETPAPQAGPPVFRPVAALPHWAQSLRGCAPLGPRV